MSAEEEEGIWVISEESMREALAQVGVDEPKRFNCPCKRKECKTFVLYGVSYVKEAMMQGITLSPGEKTLPRVGDPIIWLLLSISFSKECSRVLGLAAHKDPRGLIYNLPPDAPAAAYAILLRSGLREALLEERRAAQRN